MSAVDQVLPLLEPGSVLALGEPTHGTAEAFAWKFHVVEELATRGLLGAIAFEESYHIGVRLDAALRGHGTVDGVWSDAMGVWRTTTIIHGWRRLREINEQRAPRHRVRCVGIDSKRPDLGARVLLGAGVDTAAVRKAARRTPLRPEDVDALEDVCAQVAESRSSPEGAAAVQILRHIDAYLREPDLQGLHRRDEHMALTLMENLPAEGLTVLWAHNEHVARNPDAWGGPSMGAVLGDRLRERYVPVGLFCGEGTCRAVDPSSGDPDYRSVRLPAARSGTTDAALHDLGAELVRSSAFPHPGPRRFLGWSIDSGLSDVEARTEHELARPATDFDLLVHLPRSTADTSWVPEPQNPAGPADGVDGTIPGVASRPKGPPGPTATVSR